MSIFFLTIRAAIKDRTFIIIAFLTLIYTFVPVLSYFSMRQLQEISITLSLTLNSFILLLLSIFGGLSSLWRDIERRYTYTILSYPITRANFIFSRFLGFVFILFLITIINLALSVIVIKVTAGMYKSTLPILWLNILLAFVFAFLKYSLLLAFSFLFASFSTTLFMPFFATVAVFIAGNSIQGIYDYITTKPNEVTCIVKNTIKIIYYILPNFAAFDLTPYAAYALPISLKSVVYSFMYFLFYLTVVLSLTVAIFDRRDLS